MNNDLISREALKKELRREVSGNRVGVFFAKRVFDIIENAPTVDVSETISKFRNTAYQNGYTTGLNKRQQGEWIDNEYSDGYDYRICSICKFHTTAVCYKFCPNCGAKMRGEK